jgi:segregation and condensation protein B
MADGGQNLSDTQPPLTEDITREDVTREDLPQEDVTREQRALLCAALLAAGKPLSERELTKVLGHSHAPNVSAALEDLQTTLREQDLGLVVEEVAGGFRMVVAPHLTPALATLLSPPPLPPLSNAALETLALIAYKQPITRGELEASRGSSCTSTLETLQERELIRVVGHKDTLGKPRLYGTTQRFLLEFGLKSLTDLPPLDDAPSDFVRS